MRIKRIYQIISCFAVLLAIFVANSCSCSKQLGDCYIEVSSDSVVSDPLPPSSSKKQIRYFFDRTESMRGFTQKESETAYGRALDSVWTAGTNVGEAGTQSQIQYYEFGERDTKKLPWETVQKEVRQPNFYRYSVMRGEWVKDNRDQPFSSVVDYIFKDAPNDISNCLNIVITDLYEQNGAYQAFRLLFQYAFENGMSGALFAVESEFIGRINDVSAVKTDLNVPVENGYSTFFIFIVGDNTSVKDYSKQLSRRFKNKDLQFNEILFVIDRTNKIHSVIDRQKIANKRTFNSDEYKCISVNLKKTNLKQWVKQVLPSKKGDAQYNARPIQDRNIEAYLAMGNIGSRYIVRIPDITIDKTHFNYPVKLSIEHFNGGKTNPGEPSRFDDYNNEDKKIKGFLLDDIPDKLKEQEDQSIYLGIELENEKLAPGYYKITYTIIQTAKIPNWVEEKSASNIERLRESAQKGSRTLVLNLKTIFDDIIQEFNKIKDREIYSGELYVRKN